LLLKEGLTMQIGVETSRMVENKRVFVLDDDDIVRTVLQFMLQDDNETHDLPSLTAAYAKAEFGHPDLLLLGLSMVQAEGATLLAALRARWPLARILLVTGPGQDKAAQAWLQDGAHGVMRQPFTVEAVRRAVDLQLGRIQPSLVQLQLVPGGML